MGSRTTKRDSKGKLTVCPECNKTVRGQKGLKAHAVVCTGKPQKKKVAA